METRECKTREETTRVNITAMELVGGDGSKRKANSVLARQDDCHSFPALVYFPVTLDVQNDCLRMN